MKCVGNILNEHLAFYNLMKDKHASEQSFPDPIK
jgi:hypothetical protein